jgi:Trk K+ transport system NAD-binding subunit
MAAYRAALNGNVRQVRGLRTGGVIIEAEVCDECALSGRRVADVPWPSDAVLVAVEREGALIVPRGDLVILAGDRMSIFAVPGAAAKVEALLAAPSHGDTSPSPAPEVIEA